MSTVFGERDDREHRHRGEHRDRGREREHPADRAAGAELLLEQQLPDVGHRLQRAEQADAVRPVAVLEAAEDLALGEQHDRHELEDHGEDDQRLEELDPPVLVVADVGEDGHVELPSPCGPSAGCPAGRSAAPRRGPRRRASRSRRSAGACSAAPPTRRTATTGVGEQVRGLVVRALGEEHRAARHGGAQPRGAAHARAVADPTSTSSPSRTPSRSASTGESSTTWRGRMKRRTGERSTSGADHSERQVPSRSAPSDAATAAGGTLELRRLPRRRRPAPRPPRSTGQRTPRPPIASSVSPA